MRELQAVVAAYRQAKANGEPMVLATVVRVSGSTYRRPGARMLIARDRWLEGAVSGGCLEGHLLERAWWLAERERFSRHTFDSTSDEDITWGFGLGCNGVVEVLVERLEERDPLHPVAFVAGCLARHEAGVIATVIGDGPALGQRLTLTAGGAHASNLDGELAEAVLGLARQALALGESSEQRLGQVEVFVEVIPPPVELFVFGGGYDAVPVVQAAGALGWDVTVVVDRPGSASRARLAPARVVHVAPEVLALKREALAVVMTHNYAHDLALLRELLPRPLRYLGVLGPRRRTERLLAELRAEGLEVEREALHKLHSPIGLDLGADQPEQIALAIVAEAQAVIHGRPARSLREHGGPIHARPLEAAPRLA